MNAPKKKFNLWLCLAIAAAIFAGIYMVDLMQHHSRAKQRLARLRCLDNLDCIYRAAHMWAGDHGNQMPRAFTQISNELANPIVLLCPAKSQPRKVQEQMSSWITFDERRSSYEIVNPSVLTDNPTNLFLRCKEHGYLGYVDGSLQIAQQRINRQPNQPR